MCLIMIDDNSTKETKSSSPMPPSQDREITVENDENNNEVTKEDDSEEDSDGVRSSSSSSGMSGEVEMETATTLVTVAEVVAEEDVCENVNVKEMRKFFIEQGQDELTDRLSSRPTLC